MMTKPGAEKRSEFDGSATVGIQVVEVDAEEVEVADEGSYVQLLSWQAVVAGGLSIGLAVASGLIASSLIGTYRFSDMGVMSLVQNAVLCGCGLFYEAIRAKATPASSSSSSSHSSTHSAVIPAQYWIILGLSLAGNVYFTSLATLYLTYPVQVVLKSSKVLLAVAVRRFILHKHVGMEHYISAAVLTAGVCSLLFGLHSGGSSGGHGHAADGVAASEQSEWLPMVLPGCAAVVAAIISEAVTFWVEEQVLFDQYHASPYDVLGSGYAVATVVQLVCIAAFGQIAPTVAAIFQLTPAVIGMLIAFPSLLSGSVLIQLWLVKHYGSVAASTCQVVRKALSVWMALILHPQPLSILAILGMTMVVCSGGLHVCLSWRRRAVATEASAAIKQSA